MGCGYEVLAKLLEVGLGLGARRPSERHRVRNVGLGRMAMGCSDELADSVSREVRERKRVLDRVEGKVRDDVEAAVRRIEENVERKVAEGVDRKVEKKVEESVA